MSVQNLKNQISGYRLRQLISFLIIAALTATVIIGPSRPVEAQTTEQALKNARQRQEELADQLSELQLEKKQLNESLDELSGQLAWLNERSEEQRELYLQKTEQLEAAIAEVELAYREYAQAEEDVLAKQDQYVERMKTMFDHRNRSIYLVFLESSSIQGFFTTLQFMKIVADTDQQMLEELETAKDHADLTRQLAEEKSEEMAVVVTQLEVDLDRLKADVEATALDMNQLSRQLSEREQAEADIAVESDNVGAEVVALQQKLEAERAAKATAAAQATIAAKATAAAMAAEASAAAQATRAAEQAAIRAAEQAAIRAAEQQAAEQAARRAAEKAEQAAKEAAEKAAAEDQQQSNSSSSWRWPVPGYTHIGSGYGMRTHPIYRDRRMHTGIDISAPYGNPIVAVAAGTVILVRNSHEGQNYGGTGYGNYIVIDHGGGIATLYAHMKNTHVRTGNTVKAGDRIGTIGSTGTSTGPHLHFEVRINGQHTDPVPYLR